MTSSPQKALWRLLSIAAVVSALGTVVTLHTSRAWAGALTATPGTVGNDPDDTSRAQHKDNVNATTELKADKSLVIHSPMFQPPATFNFNTFGQPDRLGEHTRVNAAEDLSDGIFVNRNTDADAQIQVDFVCTAADTAGDFSPWAEGNLKGGNGGAAPGGGGGNYWAAKIAPQFNKRLVITKAPDIFRSAPEVKATVEALGSDGKQVAQVDVALTIAEDQGNFQDNPLEFDSDTGAVGPNYFADFDHTLTGGDTPAASAKHLTYKATANGYQSDSVTVAILDAQWEESEDDKLKGFDPLPPILDPNKPPSLVVAAGANSGNTASLYLDAGTPSVNIDTDNHPDATITPPNATPGNTPTPVAGVAAGQATATAKANASTVALMGIWVYTVKKVTYHITILNGPTGLNGNLTADLGKVAGTWSDQAAVVLTPPPGNPPVVNVPADAYKNSDPAKPSASDVYNYVKLLVSNPHDIYVYVIDSFTLSGLGTDAAAYTDGNIVILASNPAQDSDQTRALAHEFGHALGLPGDGHYYGDYFDSLKGHSDDLMGYATSYVAGGYRIHQYQADKVHQ